MSDEAITHWLRITGTVQGVSFRAFARDAARTAGVRGWVRNESDGSVRMLVNGSEARVSALVERLRTGPPGAHVTDIRREPATDETVPDDFHIAR